MSDKKIVMITMTLGSLGGSYLPALWGANWLSWASILGSAIGGLVGVWVGWKLITA